MKLFIPFDEWMSAVDERRAQPVFPDDEEEDE